MKRWIKYFIGILFIAFGIAMTIQSNLGAGTWDLLAHGEFLRFSMSVGFWQNVNFVVTLILITLIFKRKFNISTFIPGIFLGLCVDLFMKFNYAAFLNSYVLIFLGTFIMSIGVITYIRQGLIPNAVDYLMITLQEELKISTSLAKLITDMIPLVVAFILGIYPNIGTLINFLFVPIFLNLITKVTGLGID